MVDSIALHPPGPESITLKAAEDDFQTTQAVPWISDLCEARKKNPRMTNDYEWLPFTPGTVVAFEIGGG